MGSYKAEAEGHIYFYLDREDGGDPIPMRVDQVAVDLYWKAPRTTRQQIRALRKRELLPIKDFHYYIDRLTAVQNGYGDVISIGQGRDVRSVPHPLSRVGASTYHFRLLNQVTVRVPSLPEPIQVWEVDVRPRVDTVPGFVGRLFLEATSGAMTRAQGKLEFEWADVCTGWTVSQRTRVRMATSEGDTFEFGWSLNALESRDGRRYRFFIRRINPGGVDEEVRGEARFDEAGERGVAVFDAPEARELQLAKGTLFPTAHSLVLMEAAEKGELPLWRTVFDGSGVCCLWSGDQSVRAMA